MGEKKYCSVLQLRKIEIKRSDLTKDSQEISGRVGKKNRNLAYRCPYFNQEMHNNERKKNLW